MYKTLSKFSLNTLQKKVSKQWEKSSKYFKSPSLLQSTYSHHPALVDLGQNSLQMPCITKDVYQNRRTELMNLISSKASALKKTAQNQIVLIPSSTRTYMSENIPYSFRQNTDFLYLTGLKDPDCVLMLHSNTGKCLPEHSSVLFLPECNKYTERWEGRKTSLEDAVCVLGVDSAHYYDYLESYIHSYINKSNSVMLWYDYQASHFSKIHDSMHDFRANYNRVNFESPQKLLHQLRVLKSDPEVELMKHTCKIAAVSMTEVMKFTSSPMLESQLHAKMDFECRMRGADYLAFPPVVAGAERANTIHYVLNNNIVNEGETVLMDAGCEFHGYSSDLARTWPVSGKFSQPQKELYELILSVQEHLIDLCRTFPSLDYLFQVMCHRMGMELKMMGIIPVTASDDEASKAAYNFCPHHVSHYLGMDVHDCSLISRGINLQPGMVVTVEPGIYIRTDDYSVPEQYRGLCVRIEDDILITNNGPEVLTSSCPKYVKDIEQIVSEK